MNNVTNKRVYYLDILRVIACLSVIMIHVTANYLYTNFGSVNFVISNIINSLSRIGVPLFVMISGSLLLNSEYTLSKQKLINRIIKMIFEYP